MNLRTFLSTLPLLVALGVAAGPPPSVAQPAAGIKTARWHGTFDVTQKYAVHTLDPETVGSTEKRTHRIRSTCRGAKACPTMAFTRVLGDGSTKSYQLKRVKPGVYVGRTHFEGSWFCQRDGERLYTWTGRVDETMALIADRQRRGKVVRYRGGFRQLYTPYVIDDSVPTECQDYFASEGLEEGDRPEVTLSLTGTAA